MPDKGDLNSRNIYDEMLKRQYEVNKSLVDKNDKYAEILQEMSHTSRSMADTMQRLERISASIDDTLKVNTEALKSFNAYWGKLMWALVLAIIVLAGAEKVLQILA